jgi:Fe2+ or Zn2+ uptake regulation protein
VRSPTELTEIFRARGLKVTPQRQAIFRALHTSSAHPTADTVFDIVRAEMPTISLRTVYQTLNDLAAMGELHAVDLGTGSARFDPNTSPHHHLVCVSCGRIDDLDVDFPGVSIPAGNDLGFEVSTTEIVFRGRCRSCAAAHGDEADAPASRTPSTHARGEVVV